MTIAATGQPVAAVDAPSRNTRRPLDFRGILLAMDEAMASTAELASAERGEIQLETELTYDGITPVPVRVTKRDGRYKVTDDGGAVSAAGVTGRRLAYPEQIAFGDNSVNVTRQGMVWLPAVSPSDAWLATICGLVARGSVTLYERLLELEEGATS